MDSDNEDSYVQNAERAAKQLYLREEIVDVGYETSLFVEYCEQLKGTDVDAWTFEELRSCVNNFKRVYTTLEAKKIASQEEQARNARQSLIIGSDILRATQEMIRQVHAEGTPDFTAESFNYSSAESLVIAEVGQTQTEGVTSQDATRLQDEWVESKQPVSSEAVESQELSDIYEVPCKQLLPTDLSRAGAVVEVGQ